YAGTPGDDVSTRTGLADAPAANFVPTDSTSVAVENAIREPSGDHAGALSPRTPNVIWIALELDVTGSVSRNSWLALPINASCFPSGESTGAAPSSNFRPLGPRW